MPGIYNVQQIRTKTVAIPYSFYMLHTSFRDIYYYSASEHNYKKMFTFIDLQLAISMHSYKLVI